MSIPRAACLLGALRRNSPTNGRHGPTGTMCTSAADCCSAFCFGGFCEPPIR